MLVAAVLVRDRGDDQSSVKSDVDEEQLQFDSVRMLGMSIDLESWIDPSEVVNL